MGHCAEPYTDTDRTRCSRTAGLNLSASESLVRAWFGHLSALLAPAPTGAPAYAPPTLAAPHVAPPAYAGHQSPVSSLAQIASSPAPPEDPMSRKAAPASRFDLAAAALGPRQPRQALVDATSKILKSPPPRETKAADKTAPKQGAAKAPEPKRQVAAEAKEKTHASSTAIATARGKRGPPPKAGGDVESDGVVSDHSKRTEKLGDGGDEPHETGAKAGGRGKKPKLSAATKSVAVADTTAADADDERVYGRTYHNTHTHTHARTCTHTHTHHTNIHHTHTHHTHLRFLTCMLRHQIAASHTPGTLSPCGPRRRQSRHLRLRRRRRRAQTHRRPRCAAAGVGVPRSLGPCTNTSGTKLRMVARMRRRRRRRRRRASLRRLLRASVMRESHRQIR